MKIMKKCRHSRAGDDPSRCSCAWYASYSVAGKRTWQNLGNDKFRAEKLARRIAVQLDDQPAVVQHRSSTPTVDQLAGQWLAFLGATGARPTTVRTYATQISAARTYFNTAPVESLQPRDLRGYADWLRETYARNTAAGRWSVLVSMLRWAVDQELIERLPLPAKAPRFGAREKRSVPDMASIEASIAGLYEGFPKYGRLAEFLLLTGLRVGEALALEQSDIVEGAVVVRNTRRGQVLGPAKTPSSLRRVALTARAEEVLLAQLQTDPAIWSMTYKAAQQYMCRHGGGLRWHDLRHANTYLRHRAGEDLRVTQAQLGHSNLQPTLSYGWHDDSVDTLAIDGARRAPR